MIDRYRFRQAIRRWFFHPIEGAAVAVVFSFLRLLPIDTASAVGGWLGRTFGPLIGSSKRARDNLRRAFPEKGDPEIKRIVRGMWDNLGRMVGEYPHLPKIQIFSGDGRIVIEGAETIDLVREDGKPGVFFSGHLANWEIISLAATQRGVPLDRVYRAANNPWVEQLYRSGREAVEGRLIPKGPKGARELLKSLKEGRHLGMLIDQKMNDGIAVPFFGRDAMTASAPAEFALKFNCPVVGARVERLKGATFKVTVYPPIEFTPTGDRHADVLALMTRINETLEGWIREHPEQWLWVHKRWPD